MALDRYLESTRHSRQACGAVQRCRVLGRVAAVGEEGRRHWVHRRWQLEHHGGGEYSSRGAAAVVRL